MSDSRRWLRLCDLNDLEDGSMKRISVDGHPNIAVYCVNGEYFATADTCTHATASLSDGGWLDGHTVICPAHSGEFDIRTGAALCFPVETPLATYPTEIRDQTVWAAVEVTNSSSNE